MALLSLLFRPWEELSGVTSWGRGRARANIFSKMHLPVIFDFRGICIWIYLGNKSDLGFIMVSVICLTYVIKQPHIHLLAQSLYKYVCYQCVLEEALECGNKGGME